jgi:hypothetical protein
MSNPSGATLRAVQRGRAADELVLIGSDGRAVLLRGDGATPDEQIRMCAAALDLLSEALTR